MAGPWGLSVVAYAAIGAVAIGGATAVGRSAWSTSPRWDLGPEGAHALSLGGGILIAAVTILATRWLVRETTWARTLHRELRPAVLHHGPGALVLLGTSSALAEELLFRGVLAPAVGALASSVAFGLLHQLRGSARWAWVAWATLLGLLFALLFLATGSLLGPVVGHAAINVVNLRRLRDVSVTEPRARALGGLLGPR
ncbi:MAG: CPBP family intramembrane metalloprotease [Myxococcales bacterium]|nr:CPBP family intramembrane metalloprotease [Myxococcales bacterium]